jgi:ligand-binding sensor domain-containing protein
MLTDTATGFINVRTPQRRWIIALSISFWYTFWATDSSAQQIHFDQMSIAEGLSSNSVYTIFQDSYGQIWFGTLDGLDRYDGYRVDVFKHDKLKRRSISNNRVTHIYEDAKHQLWLYDEFTGSMIRYVAGKEEFTTYYLDKVAGGELKAIDSVYEQQDGSVWIRSMTGFILRYNAGEDKFEYVEKKTNLPGWYEKKGWEKVTSEFDQHLQEVKSAFTAKTVEIRKIITDSENRYWIATKYDGVYSAKLQNGVFEFTSHLHTTEKIKKISTEEIFDIYEDRSNVIWIGTKNNGLYRHTQYKYKFDHIEEIEAEKQTVSLGTVRAIAQDANNNIWIGTIDQGLIRIDPTGKTGKLYKPDPLSSTSVGHRFIRSLWIDEDEQLWIGHYHGFSRYRQSSDNFIQFFPRIHSGEEVRVFDFKKGKNNDIWMAAWDLVLRFDQRTEKYDFISRGKAIRNGFESENIRDIELDNSGDLWIAAGEKGMSIYNKTKKQFSTLVYNADVASGLPSSNLFDVFNDSHRNTWLATADGLCHFDFQKTSCETFTVNEGLPSNLVYGILEDKAGNLWLSTTKGLSKFNPKDRTFRNYDVNDGLQSNEFTENAFYQNDEGTMFFGGINGINIVRPERVPENPKPPKVAITNIKVFDRPLSEAKLFSEENIRQKLLNLEDIGLTHEQRSISFEFVAFHYVNPEKNRYAYMLEGLDNTWTFRDANVRFANYTNLEPGTYYFQLKASNSDGVWGDPIRLKITIAEPFYSSVWFISVISILALALGIFVYRWRIATVKKQQSIKAVQLELELNFLKTQVNPHFLFNTLNNIYALCQVNSRNAAPMVRKISEMMRYMIYDCTEKLVPLEKELDYLKNYIDLNQLKSSRKINASIGIDGNPSGLRIAPLLLINFLENSFKHGDLNLGGDGFINAHLNIVDHDIVFSIRNSFRDKVPGGEPQSGIGLINVQQRLNLLYPGRHSLRIEKNNSIFEIELKLKLD